MTGQGRAILVGIALAMALVPRGGSATLGTAVGANPITLKEPAVPGRSYELPSFFVINSGDEASYYSVRVERLSQGAGRPVPPGWVRIGRNHFPLNPQESMQVPLTLTVPRDAAAGDYLSNLIASTEPPDRRSGVALGAAAATRLEFQVAAGGATGPTIPWPWPWWVYLVVGAAVLISGGALLLRWLGLRIQVERRR